MTAKAASWTPSPQAIAMAKEELSLMSEAAKKMLRRELAKSRAHDRRKGRKP